MGWISYGKQYPVEEKVEDQLLLTWTGEDVKQELERKGIKFTKEQLQEIVDRTAHSLEHCECWMCIGESINWAAEEVLGDANLRNEKGIRK